jgi:hypothetical protein
MSVSVGLHVGCNEPAPGSLVQAPIPLDANIFPDQKFLDLSENQQTALLYKVSQDHFHGQVKSSYLSAVRVGVRLGVRPCVCRIYGVTL